MKELINFHNALELRDWLNKIAKNDRELETIYCESGEAFGFQMTLEHERLSDGSKVRNLWQGDQTLAR